MHHIIIQLATKDQNHIPSEQLLEKWARLALERAPSPSELTIRIVDLPEMTELNEQYRKKVGPTNVLSFPFEAPDDIPLPLDILGDVVICADVINREAKEQNKTEEAHWAHMIIHGTLHLLGYDHVKDVDANEMEALEIALLQSLGYANPYDETKISQYD